MSDQAVKQAIDYLGGPSQVARELGMTPWAISKWSISMPPRRVLWLAARTDYRFTPHQLAPELYPNPTDALPAPVNNAHSTAA